MPGLVLRATGTAQVPIGWDDIAKLTPAHVDDLRRQGLGAQPDNPGEQGLVQADRSHVSYAVGVINKLFADDHDGVHHGVSTTAEIARDGRHCSPVAADLQRRPSSCSSRQRATRGADLSVLVAPATTTPGA